MSDEEDGDDYYYYYSDEALSDGDGDNDEEKANHRESISSANFAESISFKIFDEIALPEKNSGYESKAARSEYRVLTPDEITVSQTKVIKDVAEVIDTSEDRAGVLLLHYRWNKERLLEAYYDDADAACKAAGAIQNDVDLPKGDTFLCLICFEHFPIARTYSMGCVSESAKDGSQCRFCLDCYGEYLVSKAGEGSDGCANLGCIFARCPNHGCRCIASANVWKDVIGSICPPAVDRSAGSSVSEAKAQRDKTAEEVASDPDRFGSAYKKYLRYLANSFVDINRNIKWCPSPSCEAAIEASGAVTSVTCTYKRCGFKFCFKCGRDAHAPVTCPHLDRWLEKCSNESETANWILANTKKCPNCSTRIEKNQGCNHMVCRVCQNEFCWVCGGPWSEHNTSTGGYYNCNRYNPEKGDNKGKSKAKRELDRYLHYYQRYATHEQSLKWASRQRELAETKMVKLQGKSSSSWIDVQFLEQAVEQLIVCRRVLMYTYAFAYYLENGPKKELFEYNQSMLEANTERLSELSEMDLEKMDKSEVINFTRVTCKFLERLLEHVEQDGLADQLKPLVP